jgi:Subunit ChlI of Mg-chelatase
MGLPIALALLVATEQVPPERLGQFVITGEPALDGSLRPIRGALALAMNAAAPNILEVLAEQEQPPAAPAAEVYSTPGGPDRPAPAGMVRLDNAVPGRSAYGNAGRVGGEAEDRHAYPAPDLGP